MALKRLATEKKTTLCDQKDYRKEKKHAKCSRSPGLPGFRCDADQGVERIL